MAGLTLRAESRDVALVMPRLILRCGGAVLEHCGGTRDVLGGMSRDAMGESPSGVLLDDRLECPDDDEDVIVSEIIVGARI